MLRKLGAYVDMKKINGKRKQVYKCIQFKDEKDKEDAEKTTQKEKLEYMSLAQVNKIKVPEVKEQTPKVPEVKEQTPKVPEVKEQTPKVPEVHEVKEQTPKVPEVHEVKEQLPKVPEVERKVKKARIDEITEFDECVKGLSACIPGNTQFEDYIRKEKFTFLFFDTLVETQKYTLHDLVKELAQIFQECKLAKGELYAIALYLYT
jgi:ribosomal protein S30